MPGRAPPVPFLGRVDEVARLEATLAGLGDRPYAVVLAGDPGVGKSRLLAEFGERAHAHGAQVLAGACLDVGDTWPYHPLKLALRRHVEAGLQRCPERGALGAGATRLLDVLDEGSAGNAGGGSVLGQLHAGLCALAVDRPLVVLLDDLQWLDSSTRRLVLTLLSGLTSARLLILSAVRTEHLQGTSPVRGLLHELRRSRSAEMLRLDPLDRDLSMQLAERVSGRRLAPAGAELVWRRSGGNPFAIEELVHVQPDATELPDSLRDMVLSRVNALPELAQDVVRAVSVAVKPVSHQLLVRVMGSDRGDISAAVRAAVSAELLNINSDGYVVRHGLVQEAVRAELLPGEALTLHRSFAGALSDGVGPTHHDQLAHHWRQAGDPDRALPAVVAAAEEAERLHAPGEAWSNWQHALELAGEAHGQLGRSLLLRAAEAAFQTGDHDAALELADRAAAEPPGSDAPPTSGERPPALLGPIRARYLAAAGRLEAAVHEYEQALRDLALSPERRAEFEARSAELLVRLGRYREAERHARQALQLTANLPSAIESRVVASAALGFSQAYLDDSDGGRASCLGAVRDAEASGEADVIGTAYLHLADLLSGPLNELEEGVAVALRGAARVADLSGRGEHISRLAASAANGLFRVGRWKQAAQVASDALGRDPTGAAAVDLLLARARISMGLGELEAAQRDLRSAETLLADEAGSKQTVPLATLHAGLAMWHGDPAGARAAVRRGLRAAGRGCDDVWLLAPLIWHGLRAEAEAVADGRTADEVAIRALTTMRAHLRNECARAAPQIKDVVQGYELLDDAELTRLDGRSDAGVWRCSAEYWESRRHPYPAAYARLRQAEALLYERSRSRESGDALTRAYRAARDLSAGPLAAQIETLAARARIRLEDPGRRPAAEPGERRPGPDAPLTRREREVLAEVATGLSNREIGRRLYISERTAGVHVSRILAKLHARTRVEATAIYLRSEQDGTSFGGS